MRWTQEDLDKHLRRKPTPSPPPVPATPKVAKFRNRKTVANGVTFDSGKEARRWQELQLMALAGAITELKRQVSFDLCVNGMLICRYIADATYRENGMLVCEDVKSPISRRQGDYRIKFKLMRAVHGIEIRET